MACTNAADRPDTLPVPWHGSNLVGVPSALIASTAFQAEPRPLLIAGAREAHAGLFELLQHCPTAADARQVFAQYMALAFGLLPGGGSAAPRHRPASYLKLLQGWGLDANGAAGAVFKGWVESRFGLPPTFHQAPLARFPSAAWVTYLEQKATARWHNNHIGQQLDLLHGYAQWMLARFGLVAEPGARHVRLWRGSTRV